MYTSVQLWKHMHEIYLHVAHWTLLKYLGIPWLRSSFIFTQNKNKNTFSFPKNISIRVFKSDLDRYAGYTVEQHKSLTQDLFFFRHDSFSSQHWTATRKVKNLDNPTLTSSAQPHTVYMFTIYNVTIVLVALYRALKYDRRQAVLCIYECNHIRKKSSVESIIEWRIKKSTNII